MSKIQQKQRKVLTWNLRIIKKDKEPSHQQERLDWQQKAEIRRQQGFDHRNADQQAQRDQQTAVTNKQASLIFRLNIRHRQQQPKKRLFDITEQVRALQLSILYAYQVEITRIKETKEHKGIKKSAFANFAHTVGCWHGATVFHFHIYQALH